MHKKVFICGGHVTPAIAVIDELRDDFDIVFVGRTYAVEHTLVIEKGIKFLPIHKFPIGFFQALGYCLRERPNLVLSFGGGVALPVALAAMVLGIPVVTHEQTLSLGRANRIIAKIAAEVCVTFAETQKQFPSAILTGLPMRKELFLEPKKPAYTLDETYPLIYITGGSQGAKSLNDAIGPAIATLTKSYTVIHQTGPVSYPSQERYITESFVSIDTLSWILHHAKIVIGRSGANTTVELAALGKVAILVPLPWSADNEQRKNAEWLAARGAAVVCEQNDLTPERIQQTIRDVERNYAALTARAEKFSGAVPRDGAQRLANVVRTLLARTR